MYFVIGYTPNHWDVNARVFTLVVLGFMISFYTSKIVFTHSDDVDTKWFVLELSKKFGFWAKKNLNECGISLGFISFYLARYKELVVYMGA